MCKPARRLYLLLFFACLALFIFGGCHPAGAESIVQTLPFTSVFQQKAQIAIPVTAQPTNVAMDFPAPLAQKHGVLCIKFRAFLKTDTPGGWGNYLNLNLNGKSLSANMPDGSDRLLNRRDTGFTTDNTKILWWDKDTMLTFFGSESALDQRIASPREEGYWYVLNISDAANLSKLGLDDRIESGSLNHLVIENMYSGKSACREMLIKDLSIGFIPQAELDKLRLIRTTTLPCLTGKTLKSGGYSLVVTASGAMELNAGTDRYLISSAYSYPDKTIGYNEFSWEGQSSPEWKTLVKSSKIAGVISVKGEGRRYTVTRTITAKDGKFLISDTVENKSDAPLGMDIRYRAVVPTPFATGDVYLCGIPDSHRMDACAANPTAFVRQSKSSLGIVCEDTLFRLQLTVDRTDDSVLFGTEHFGLKPHAKYTLEWTLYPSQAKDYFAFVNRVRKDWKVNFTIPGPATFSVKFLPKRKMSLYMMKPWFLYFNGVALTDAQFRDVQKAQIAKLLATQPDATPIGLIETNLVPLKYAETKGGILTDKTYGLELNDQQAESFHRLPWYDSMIKTKEGRPYVDTLYASPPFIDIMVYPAPGNYQLKYLLYQIDYLMDSVGFKGIYLDQFELASTDTGIGRADYSNWDGHTVDLDSRGEIVREYTDGTYVGTPARVQMIKHVQNKGGILITNGHSYARETTGLGALNFSETEWDVSTGEEILNWNEPPALPTIAEAHLDTPIGLGIRPARFGKFGEEHVAELIHKWVITFLKNGILYYYYEDTIPETGPGAGEYGELNHMFPFTPVELHAGWVVGKERILTAKSGSYFWGHKERPVVLLFDIKGKSKTPDAKITRQGHGWQVEIKMADWQETAVIEAN